MHRPAPTVGRVVVSGFSTSVPRLHTLMNAHLPDSRYEAPLWWASRLEGGLDDAQDFNQAWKKQWIDGVADGFQSYVDAAAAWVQQTFNRRIRIYKSEHTRGCKPSGIQARAVGRAG